MNTFFLLCELAAIFISAYGTAMISAFIDYIIGSPSSGEINQGRIFARVGVYLVRKHDQFEQKESIRYADKIGLNAPDFVYQNIAAFYRRNIWKPLGACASCSNVWLSAIVGVFLFWYFSWNWIFILFFIVASNYYIRKILNL